MDSKSLISVKRPTTILDRPLSKGKAEVNFGCLNFCY